MPKFLMFFIIFFTGSSATASIGKSITTQMKSQFQRQADLNELILQKFDFSPENLYSAKVTKVEAKNNILTVSADFYLKPELFNNLKDFLKDTTDMYWEGDDVNKFKFAAFDPSAWLGLVHPFKGCKHSFPHYAIQSKEHRNPSDKCPSAVVILETDEETFIGEYTSIVPQIVGGGFHYFIKLTDNSGNSYTNDLVYTLKGDDIPIKFFKRQYKNEDYFEWFFRWSSNPFWSGKINMTLSPSDLNILEEVKEISVGFMPLKYYIAI